MYSDMANYVTLLKSLISNTIPLYYITLFAPPPKKLLWLCGMFRFPTKAKMVHVHIIFLVACLYCISDDNT